jgi:hypothetical protein
MEVCEMLDGIKLKAVAANQKRVADDMEKQKAVLLDMSLQAHAATHVEPNVKTASVAAVVFNPLPQKSSDVCGHRNIAVRASWFVVHVF